MIGENICRVLCGTVIDFTAFLCLSLLFQAAFRYSTANACGGGATPRSVHKALYQYDLLHKHSSFMIFLHHPGFSADCSE